MIFYDFRRGLNQQQCDDQLASAFGDEAQSRATMFRSFSEFHRGRTSLQDEFREGRPQSVVMPEKIDPVRELILQDHHMTHRESEACLCISSKKARVDWCKEILKKYSRVASKDVYKIVTGDESWIHAYEN